MPGFVPDMSRIRGEGLEILTDGYILGIIFHGRVVYQTESPIIIRAILRTGQAGQQAHDILHRTRQFIAAQVTHPTPQEDPQAEQQLQPHRPPHPTRPAPQQPEQTAILSQKPWIKRLIFRIVLIGVYITIILLRQTLHLLAHASGITLDAPQPPRTRRVRHQQQQARLASARYRRADRIANSSRAAQAVVAAAAAALATRPSQAIPIPIPEEDAVQPVVADVRVDRRARVEEVSDVEGTENQGRTTGRGQTGQRGAEQQRRRAGRRRSKSMGDDRW